MNEFVGFAEPSFGQSRDHALNGGTAYPFARTNRLKRVLAQARRAHQRAHTCCCDLLA